MIKYSIGYSTSSIFAIIIAYIVFNDYMVIPQFVFLSYLIPRVFITFLSIFTFAFVLVISFENKVIYPFALSGFFFILGFAFESVSFFLLNTSSIVNIEISKTFFKISQIAITIAPILLMYFIVTFFSKKPNFLEFSPIIFEAIIEVIYQPLDLTIGITTLNINNTRVSHWIYQPVKLWINIIYYLSILWIVVYSTYLILKSRKDVIDKSMKRQQDVFILCIGTVFIIAPIIFYINQFIQEPLLRFVWMSVIGRSFVVLGLSIFIISYINSDRKIDFFQPQPLEAIYILDNSTNEILIEKKFRTSNVKDLALMVSDHIDGINNLISEIIKDEDQINLLNIDSNEILIKEINQYDITLMLISQYNTSIITNRFSKLSDAISNYGPTDQIKPEIIVLAKMVDTIFGV